MIYYLFIDKNRKAKHGINYKKISSQFEKKKK